MKLKQKVLQDHKRERKKLIPPMLQIGKFIDVEWKKVIIPELIWIALINDKYGIKEGAEISLSLPREVHLLKNFDSTKQFFMISSFNALDDIQKAEVLNNLRKKDALEKILAALYPLIVYYPKCPLSFLFENNIDKNTNSLLIFEFKNTLSKMFNRWNTDATFVQANAIYIAFDSGKLKVFKGLQLADFPEVKDFPYTEKSKLVASSIRSALNSYFGSDKNFTNDWPSYFWNNGLELQKCSITNYYERRKSEDGI